MSAGHGHSRANLKHPNELKTLLAEGGAPELMRRFQHLDVDHDIPDLAGYSVDGTTRYLDKDFFHALIDPEVAKQNGVGEIDTGLSPDDTVECILEHEAVEKVLLDSDNPIDTYLEAHEYATCAEHEMVRKKGGKPIQYERGLKDAIAFCQGKDPANPPPELACAPLLDDPDKDDLRDLKALRKLGVEDAFKVSKASVDYSKSTGEDQCAGCRNWQEDRGAELSRCAVVAGRVRHDRWCRRYQQMEQTDGQGNGIQGGGSQGGAEPQDQESGGSGGGGEPQRQPGGQAQEPQPQEGQVAPERAQ